MDNGQRANNYTVRILQYLTVENLQNDLMDIEDYSEEVYQAFERLIEELEEVTE